MAIERPQFTFSAMFNVQNKLSPQYLRNNGDYHQKKKLLKETLKINLNLWLGTF